MPFDAGTIQSSMEHDDVDVSNIEKRKFTWVVVSALPF
jgi:hypothetical protein